MSSPSKNIRVDGRKSDELRRVQFEPDFIIYPEGSVLIAMGNTKVLCNVTIEERQPTWMKYQGLSGGWVTGEYSLLPRATHTRNQRETQGLSGRTHEIKRLIGRSLRAAVDLEKLGPRTCTIDCDVIQADGGTRTAAITGGYVALHLALDRMVKRGVVPKGVIKTQVAAVSVGMKGERVLLDLCYAEDSGADVDANVVMTAEGKFIEVQGTGEEGDFTRDELDRLLDLAEVGIKRLFALQTRTIEGLKKGPKRTQKTRK